MPDPINLNIVRKAKKRAEKKARADRNAVQFGRTKAQRMLDVTKSEKMRRVLDGHRFEDDDT